MKTQTENLFQALFAKLVPPVGPSLFVEGELLRAIAKIRYRLYNDGDKWYQGYGCETAGPAAAFIIAKAPKEIAEAMENCKGQRYEKKVDAILEMIVDHVEGLQGKHTSHTDDMYNHKSLFTQYK